MKKLLDVAHGKLINIIGRPEPTTPANWSGSANRKKKKQAMFNDQLPLAEFMETMKKIQRARGPGKKNKRKLENKKLPPSNRLQSCLETNSHPSAPSKHLT